MCSPLLRFVGNAVAGERPGSSSGEKAARSLALALLDAWPQLDGFTKRGALDFADLVGEAPSAAEDLFYVRGHHQ